jgi:hypothetical protein
VLAALLLAGVRNIAPRPDVGFKFHGVLVVNSAHLASIASPDAHRWLPIFWALDYFKDTQAQQQRQRPWSLPAVREDRVPHADQARGDFVAAMDAWDEDKADASIAALARSGGAQDIYELFYRYGARDFRDIGHKAIYVANSRRTLDCIGWQHAEPVLRSLAYALLQHEGENPSRRDGEPDRPWRANAERAKRMRNDWLDGRVDAKATEAFWEVLRTGSADDASEKVVELSNAGIAPQALWDALFLAGGELLMRAPGIVPIHALTSTNALHYAWRSSGNDDTRRMLLLQNAAFLPLFREATRSRNKLADRNLATLEPQPLEHSGADAVGEIFADVDAAPLAAAAKVLSYVDEHTQPTELIDAARVLIFLKGTNAHDYKHVSPRWRAQFLASSVFNLRGSTEPDNKLVARTRAALA